MIDHDTVTPRKKKKINGINAVPSALSKKRVLIVMLKNAASGIPITRTWRVEWVVLRISLRLKTTRRTTNK
jgi:hypothetical protein